jgi:hypothetical protein
VPSAISWRFKTSNMMYLQMVESKFEDVFTILQRGCQNKHWQPCKCNFGIGTPL